MLGVEPFLTLFAYNGLYVGAGLEALHIIMYSEIEFILFVFKICNGMQLRRGGVTAVPERCHVLSQPQSAAESRLSFSRLLHRCPLQATTLAIFYCDNIQVNPSVQKTIMASAYYEFYRGSS